MQNSQFERLLKLAQRTGDRLIVTDPSGHEPVVILPLSEYEGLLDFDSFREEGEGEDDEEGARDHVSEFEVESDDDGEIPGGGGFDPIALERQVLAAMPADEPEVVPMVSVETQQIRAVEAPQFTEEKVALKEELPRRAIARRGREDGGEEQFYLEPV